MSMNNQGRPTGTGSGGFNPGAGRAGFNVHARYFLKQAESAAA